MNNIFEGMDISEIDSIIDGYVIPNRDKDIHVKFLENLKKNKSNYAIQLMKKSIVALIKIYFGDSYKTCNVMGYLDSFLKLTNHSKYMSNEYICDSYQLNLLRPYFTGKNFPDIFVVLMKEDDARLFTVTIDFDTNSILRTNDGFMVLRKISENDSELFKKSTLIL